MGQQEIYKFLKKNPEKWFTRQELNQKLGGSQSMNRSLRVMVRYNEIVVRVIKHPSGYRKPVYRLK